MNAPYGQPGYQHPAPMYGVPQPEPRNGLGLAALIVALCGMPFAIAPITSGFTLLAGLVAVPLALAGLGRVRKGRATNRKTTIAGLIVGALAVILGIVGISIMMNATAKFVNDMQQLAPTTIAPAAPAENSAPSLAPAPAQSGPLVGTFGDRIDYSDGLSLQVSQPQEFRPNRYSIGHAAGNRALIFDVTITNNTGEGADILTTQVNATFGGRQVEKIFGEGATENPSGTVLPGKSSTFRVALSVPKEAGELQVEVTPMGWTYETAIFTAQI